MRANMSLASPAGQHAVRLAVVVAGPELIALHAPLQRSYWIVGAAAALRPEFGATLTRGAERIVGTCAGVALAGAIAVTLHPSLGVTVPIIALLAWAAYAVFPASFAAGFAFITAMVVFLLDVVTPSTLTTATDRLLDTLVGGAIGLLAYLIWPTWSHKPARQALADVIAAHRRYLAAILASIIHGTRIDHNEIRRLARASQLARTDAEAAVGRSLAEPARRRIDANHSQATLSALRRAPACRPAADRRPHPTLRGRGRPARAHSSQLPPRP
jgi:uncharacterized membrane protein YccC